MVRTTTPKSKVASVRAVGRAIDIPEAFSDTGPDERSGDPEGRYCGLSFALCMTAPHFLVSAWTK
jgi:hypothetical protein